MATIQPAVFPKCLVDELINQLGCDAIKESINNPGREDTTLIHKETLLDSFSTTASIKQYSKDNWYDTEWIEIEDFIDYITIYANVGGDTKGKYQEYMDYNHKYYGITISDVMLSVPSYHRIEDLKIRKNIEPARFEYLAIWMINQKIKQDPFLKNYADGLCKASYQTSIAEIGNRYYDMVFDHLGIVIEIQEDTKPHENNENDTLKKAIVVVNQQRIAYIKHSGFKVSNVEYINEKYLEIRKMLIQSILCSKSKESRFISAKSIRKAYLKHVFQNMMKDEIKNIKDKLKAFRKNTSFDNKDQKKICGLLKRLQSLETYFKNPDSNLLETIFNLKSDSELCVNKFNVPFDEVCEIFEIHKLAEKDILRDRVYDMATYREDNNGLFLDWKGLMRLGLKSHSDDSIVIEEYLLCVQEIYDHMLQNIEQHYTACLDLSKDMIDKRDRHVKETIQKKFVNKISDLEYTNSKLLNNYDLLIKETNEMYKQARSLYNSLKVKKMNQREVGFSKKCDEHLNKIQNILHHNVGKTFTVVAEYHKSVIKELPDFPIIHDDGRANFFPWVRKEDFESICARFDLGARVTQKIAKYFNGTFTDFKKVELIRGVIVDPNQTLYIDHISPKKEIETEEDEKALYEWGSEFLRRCQEDQDNEEPDVTEETSSEPESSRNVLDF
jgi:hypothetical protein